MAPLAADGAERVLRFSVKTPDIPLEPSDAWLFQGELSDYHVGRVNHRELPETLLSRRIAVNAWFDPGSGQTEVEPSATLEAGEVYTLAAPGWGKIALPGINGVGFFTVYILAPLLGGIAGVGLYQRWIGPTIAGSREQPRADEDATSSDRDRQTRPQHAAAR